MITRQKNSILVIVAHPDDEVLGCGGTIAKHVSQGDDVYILILADGVTSRGNSNEEMTLRHKASIEAAAVLGAHPPILKNMPDNKMDSLPLLEIVQQIEPILEEIQPNIIYTHNGSDLNIDHQLTHKAVLTACRPLPERKIQAIFSFEVLSSTEWNLFGQAGTFSPVHFVDITTTFKRKYEALQCYQKEMREFPHPRSYEAVQSLALLRGVHAGLQYAEAFGVLRQFWR